MSRVLTMRSALGMTQTELAQLLGVHGLTVSKWERGILTPSTYHEAIFFAADMAVRRRPDVGRACVSVMAERGIGMALYELLKAAFE